MHILHLIDIFIFEINSMAQKKLNNSLNSIGSSITTTGDIDVDVSSMKTIGSSIIKDIKDRNWNNLKNPNVLISRVSKFIPKS